MLHKDTFLITLLVFSLTNLKCEKLADADAPFTNISEANVYANNATAIAVLTGIYARMAYEASFTGSEGLSLTGGLSADEFTLYGGTSLLKHSAYYTNALIANNTLNIGTEYWTAFYNYLFICNAAIEGLTNAQSLTPAVRQQLLGEARFMRAFFYFYLVTLYGDVPLVTSTDYNKNAVLPRTAKKDVYAQMIVDLKEAQGLLSEDYLQADLQTITDERVRPTKWAAVALLARVYLYANDWANAAAQATLVVQHSTLYNLLPLNDVFLMNSMEAIWQLQTLNIGHNTEDAWTFIIPATGPDDVHPVHLSPQLLNSFELGDQRRSSWVDSIKMPDATYYYPYKYKSATLDAPSTEYLMVLRLGEQYLIRAEARAQQGDLTGAVSDLNMIRNRAGLSGTTATTQTQLITAIQQERLVELFSEWAHRWLDLKRTNTIDKVMTVVTLQKGGAWQSGDQLYPLPFEDLQKDPNLTQNPNY